MFTRQPEFQYWDRNPRMPSPPPPQGACDCQFHIYEDPAIYPTRPKPPYEAIDATISDAVTMHSALGFKRGVIVHSGIYGTDASLLIDALEGLDGGKHVVGEGLPCPAEIGVVCEQMRGCRHIVPVDLLFADHAAQLGRIEHRNDLRKFDRYARPTDLELVLLAGHHHAAGDPQFH